MERGDGSTSPRTDILPCFRSGVAFKSRKSGHSFDIGEGYMSEQTMTHLDGFHEA